MLRNMPHTVKVIAVDKITSPSGGKTTVRTDKGIFPGLVRPRQS